MTETAAQVGDLTLLTIDEVADVLGVSRPTVYRLAKERELPLIHIGRSSRVPRRAVENYIDRRVIAASDNA